VSSASICEPECPSILASALLSWRSPEWVRVILFDVGSGLDATITPPASVCAGVRQTIFITTGKPIIGARSWWPRAAYFAIPPRNRDAVSVSNLLPSGAVRLVRLAPWNLHRVFCGRQLWNSTLVFYAWRGILVRRQRRPAGQHLTLPAHAHRGDG